MMGTEFTPGPWTADDRTERFAIFAKSQHTGETFELASVQLDDADDVAGNDGLAANAALIAAAPELLEALKEALACGGTSPLDSGHLLCPECIRQGRAAIAKAEGK